MLFEYILGVFISVGMSLQAVGVRPGTRPVHVTFNNVSPLAILINEVDSYPNTWEHFSDDDHDPLPPVNPLTYKYYSRINMNDVESHLMATSAVRFDAANLEFLEPQPPSVMTLITRMSLFLPLCFTLNRVFCALFCFSDVHIISRTFFRPSS